MTIKKMFLVLALLSFAEFVLAANPQKLLKGYESQSGKASTTRGEQFFNAKHGKEWRFTPRTINSRFNRHLAHQPSSDSSQAYEFTDGPLVRDSNS